MICSMKLRPSGLELWHSIISTSVIWRISGIELLAQCDPRGDKRYVTLIGGNITLQSTKITKLTSVETEGYLRSYYRFRYGRYGRIYFTPPHRIWHPSHSTSSSSSMMHRIILFRMDWWTVIVMA